MWPHIYNTHTNMALTCCQHGACGTKMVLMWHLCGVDVNFVYVKNISSELISLQKEPTST